jgi:hypothetical protein
MPDGSPRSFHPGLCGSLPPARILMHFLGGNATDVETVWHVSLYSPLKSLVTDTKFRSRKEFDLSRSACAIHSVRVAGRP